MTELLASLADLAFRPRSIALVGVSEKTGTPTWRPLHYLRRSGYTGRVYPVHATRSTVQGERCWPSLDALPEVPEHVFLLVPTRSVHDEIARCVALSVPLVTVLASGFADAGEAGAALQGRIADLLKGSQTRLLGPSSLGVANLADGVPVTANAAMAGDFPVGKLLFASHSGSLMGAMATRAKARGAGYAALVSVGSEADITLAELCESTLDDPAIEGYVLFLEHLKNAVALKRLASAARERGKPVVAYKLGRTRQAARMAATHTGAIVGPDDLADAYFRDCGIVRVHQMDALAPTAVLARQIRSAAGRRPRIGIVSTTGGGAAMLVDELGMRELTVTAPSVDTREQLARAGIQYTGGDVIDLTLAGTRPEVMQGALAAVLDPDRYDLVVVVLGSSASAQAAAATQPVIQAVRTAACPCCVLVLPEAPEALRLLSEAGLAAFSAPELCAEGIAALCSAEIGRRRTGNEHQCLPVVPDASMAQALKVLGIPAAAECTVSLDGSSGKPLPFDFPVAVKVADPAIEHKSDLGGVILNVADAAGLKQALATLSERFRPMGCTQAQVQPMVLDGVGEVLLGFLRDADIGPVVTLAPGGVLAELAQRRSVRLAPVDEAEAMSMVLELPAIVALTGYRGRVAGDLKALAHAIHRLSLLAMCPQVTEAEINPLIVLPEGQGVVAVDFLLHTE